jgi:nucleotide-binding universal stress UspA family protein
MTRRGYAANMAKGTRMYHHILIPTDGSELSKLAIQEGIALAKALGARVTAITVTMPLHVFMARTSTTPVTHEQYKEDMEALASRHLDKAKNIAAAAGVPCTLMHVEHEHPYRAIIDAALNQGCDAIHMASHGRGGMSAMCSAARH